MRRLLSWMFCLSVFGLPMLGCGSDSVSSVGVPNSLPASGVYNGFVLGRVMLKTPMKEGRVRVLDLQGNALREITTDRLGFFYYRGQLPADFSVVASPAGSRDEYRLEHRGGWKGGTLYVNCATTLAAAYARAHPELTYPLAAGRVHRFLKLQSNYHLAWVSTVRTRRFNPATFYNGVETLGLQAYLSTQIEAIDNPARLSILLDAAAGLSEAVGSTLLTDVINASAGGAIGSALNSMNMNFGTSAALDEIIDILGQIQGQLSTLSSTLQKDSAYTNLLTQTENLASAVTNITLQTATINTTASNYLKTHPSPPDYNVPQSVPSDVAAAVNGLNSFDLNDNIQTLVDGTIGGQGVPSIISLYTTNQMAGIDITSGSSYNGYPLRRNALTDGQGNVAGFYINVIAQAINLVSEFAHLKAPAALPLANAITDVTTVQGQIQQARWLVPDDLPSDEVLVDLEAGVMWMLAFQEPADYDTASSFCSNLEIGPYDDWNLACEERLENFITNRLLPLVGLSGSSWGNVDASLWTAAFAQLGFDTTYYPTSKGQGTFFNQDTNIDFGSTNFYEWNGSTEKNPSTFELSSVFGSDETPYLVYRVYPGDPEAGLRASAADPTVQFTDELANVQGVVDAQGNELYVSPLSTGIFYGAMVLTTGAPTSVADPGTQPLVPANPNQLRALQAFQANVVSTSDCPYTPALGSYFAGGTFFDVTPRCFYESLNPNVASVSNAVPSISPLPSPNLNGVIAPLPSPNPNAPPPGPVGRITWHPSLSGAALPNVTFKATLGGLTGTSSFGNSTATVTLSPPAGLQPQFASLQILPVNQQYNLVSSANVVVNCTATAFYADGQFVDVTTDANITWLAFDGNGYLLNQTSLGGFGLLTGGSKNQLFLTNQVTTPTITIAGVYQGPWGSQVTTARLGLLLAPQPSPSPTASPTVIGLDIFPKNPTFASLPAQASFLGIANLSDNRQQIATPNLQWNLVSNTGVIGIPPTQGSISVGNVTALARLTAQYPGPFVSVSCSFAPTNRVAFTNWTKK